MIFNLSFCNKYVVLSLETNRFLDSIHWFYLKELEILETRDTVRFGLYLDLQYTRNTIFRISINVLSFHITTHKLCRGLPVDSFQYFDSFNSHMSFSIFFPWQSIDYQWFILEQHRPLTLPLYMVHTPNFTGVWVARVLFFLRVFCFRK